MRNRSFDVWVKYEFLYYLMSAKWFKKAVWLLVCWWTDWQMCCWTSSSFDNLVFLSHSLKANFDIHLIQCLLLSTSSHEVWHALSGDLTVLPAHSHVYPRVERTLSVFVFPAKAGPHLHLMQWFIRCLLTTSFSYLFRRTADNHVGGIIPPRWRTPKMI